MRFSVIIPNWNGAHHLPTCLDSLRRQTLPPHEIIVVDNASTDHSRALIATHYPEVRLIALARNRRFAGACNVGIRASSGDVVVLLNNDTEADPHWLENLARCFEQHPEAGCVASKIRLFDRRDHLHSAGDFYSRCGVPGNRGVWQKDEGQFDTPFVFGACGAAAAYRRAMLDRIGLLDERFAFSCEDVDLAWRAQLAGYRCAFAHDAIVYHKVSATGGGVINSFYDGRNFIWLLAKDVPAEVLRENWRCIVREQVRIFWRALRAWRGKAARMRLLGQLVGILTWPLMLPARRRVQRSRVIDAQAVRELLSDA